MAEYICCRSCIEPDCRGCNMYILEKALKQGRFKQLKDNSKTIHITADVQHVIHCKDCFYYQEAKVNTKGFLICPASDMEITEDDFCSYAESGEAYANK